MTTLKNSICDHTQKLKLWQNTKTQLVIKFKNFISDIAKNSNSAKIKKSSFEKNKCLTKKYFGKNTLTP